MSEIGFQKGKAIRNVAKGLAFGIGVFLIAYVSEIFISIGKGSFDSLQIYVSTYAVDKNLGYHTEWYFFLICFAGNIVNVVMEEGIFRGLFQKLLERKYSFMISAFIASILFGFWHMVGPVRNFVDGSCGIEGMIANAIMLVLTSGRVIKLESWSF